VTCTDGHWVAVSILFLFYSISILFHFYSISILFLFYFYSISILFLSYFYPISILFLFYFYSISIQVTLPMCHAQNQFMPWDVQLEKVQIRRQLLKQIQASRYLVKVKVCFRPMCQTWYYRKLIVMKGLFLGISAAGEWSGGLYCTRPSLLGFRLVNSFPCCPFFSTKQSYIQLQLGGLENAFVPPTFLCIRQLNVKLGERQLLLDPLWLANPAKSTRGRHPADGRAKENAQLTRASRTDRL
jgi:hypothetical protein